MKRRKGSRVMQGRRASAAAALALLLAFGMAQGGRADVPGQSGNISSAAGLSSGFTGPGSTGEGKPSVVEISGGPSNGNIGGGSGTAGSGSAPTLNINTTLMMRNSIDAADPGQAGTNIAVAGITAMTGYVVSEDGFEAMEDSSLELGGARIIMMKGNENGQQVCIVIEGNDGSTIVVDGGIQSNAQFLGRYLHTHGRKVDAWLLTHPHADHAGALAVILEKQRDTTVYNDYADIDIRAIYHSFPSLDFYRQEENPYRMPFIEELYADLDAFDQSRIHYNSAPGTEFSVGNISVKVLNQPLQISVDSGNNTTVAYRITINGKRLLILGDMPYETAENMLATMDPEELRADIVQMAHHGQHGGSYAFYDAVHPRYALWPTHRALWEEVGNAYEPDQEVYTIALTKSWMDQIGVEKNYIMADGNWILR